MWFWFSSNTVQVPGTNWWLTGKDTWLLSPHSPKNVRENACFQDKAKMENVGVYDRTVIHGYVRIEIVLKPSRKQVRRNVWEMACVASSNSHLPGKKLAQ